MPWSVQLDQGKGQSKIEPTHCNIGGDVTTTAISNSASSSFITCQLQADTHHHTRPLIQNRPKKHWGESSMNCNWIRGQLEKPCGMKLCWCWVPPLGKAGLKNNMKIGSAYGMSTVSSVQKSILKGGRGISLPSMAPTIYKSPVEWKEMSYDLCRARYLPPLLECWGNREPEAWQLPVQAISVDKWRKYKHIEFSSQLKFHPLAWI